MAKSKRSFGKYEREKKRLKKREDKKKKKEERKEAKEDHSGIPFAYVDEFGNLSDTPIDKDVKTTIDVTSIEISIPKKIEEEVDPIRNGTVAYFDSSKGFGFIIDSETDEKYFTHVSGLIHEVIENDKVTFELEKGLRGMNAIRVTKIDQSE